MAKTPNNIEKIMSSGGPNETPLDMQKFIQLADKEPIEFDVMQDLADTIKRDFEKEKQPGESFIDWLQSKPTDYFKRIELSGGGKVINFADYAKAKDSKVKEIDLASYFTPGKTLASLTEAEREVVNNLLRMSLGKKD